MSVSIGHVGIEIRRAHVLYATNAGRDSKGVVERISNAACYDYEGTYLYGIVRETKPDAVVETGVASGVSSHAILQAMEDYGKGFLCPIDSPTLLYLSTKETPQATWFLRVSAAGSRCLATVALCLLRYWTRSVQSASSFMTACTLTNI